jgi:hypothetical protein
MRPGIMTADIEQAACAPRSFGVDLGVGTNWYGRGVTEIRPSDRNGAAPDRRLRRAALKRVITHSCQSAYRIRDGLAE